jgi:hypothetical protein
MSQCFWAGVKSSLPDLKGMLVGYTLSLVFPIVAAYGLVKGIVGAGQFLGSYGAALMTGNTPCADYMSGQLLVGSTTLLVTALLGEFMASGSPLRGMSKFGGIMSAETTAGGGTLYTSVGGINSADVAAAINNAMYTEGEINVLSGVHGFIDGTMEAAAEFFQSDVAGFGDLPGVTVHDMTTLSPAQIESMVNGSGTTIAAFCDSAACIAQILGGK